MKELFIVNYYLEAVGTWALFHATHSLLVASDHAKELKDGGYEVNLQSVIIGDNGQIMSDYPVLSAE